jgi:hypothetical protein
MPAFGFVVTFIVLFAGIALAPASAAERRVALVIGNSAYQNLPPLADPAADATDMASALAGMGYEVIHAENLSMDGFRSSMQQFFGRMDGADAALLFYAGQAMQAGGVNYLLPVDADLEQPTDVLFDAIPLQDIVHLMERQVPVSIVLVDGSRDNGRKAAGSAADGGAGKPGLAAEKARTGTYLAFAAQPDRISLDGNGRNSPFTRALLDHIATPDADIRLVMADVRKAVAEATDYRQIPWESSSLTGRFSLRASDTGGNVARGLVILPADIGAASANGRPTDLSGAGQAVDAPPGPQPAKPLALPPPTATSPAGGAEPPSAPATASAPPSEPATPPAPAPASAADLVSLVQEELIRVGCLAGEADGAWGPVSAAALTEWSRHREVRTAASGPNQETLDILRGEKGRVCPLTCSAGETVRDGRCVARSCPAGQHFGADGTCRADATVAQKPAPRSAPPVRKKAPGRGNKSSNNAVEYCTVCPDS